MYLNKFREGDRNKIKALEKEISKLKGTNLDNDIQNTLAYINDDSSVDHICDNIYISGYRPATIKEKLNTYNIKFILCAAKELPPAFPNDFTYKTLPIYDSEHIKIDKYFKECFDFIEKCGASNNILIHCGAGISRSSSIVIAYLIYSKKIPYSDAVKIVKEKRSIVKPNQGFEKILRNFSYEQTNKF